MPLKFNRITPSLPVDSVPASIEFYTTKLGFRVAGRDRDDHTWLQLVGEEETLDRYNAIINVYLRRRGFPDVKDDKGPGKIYIRCDDGSESDLKAHFSNLVENGVKVISEISVKPWGVRDFTIADLDGNMINFSQQVAGWTAPAQRESEELPLGHSLRYGAGRNGSTS